VPRLPPQPDSCDGHAVQQGDRKKPIRLEVTAEEQAMATVLIILIVLAIFAIKVAVGILINADISGL
jgi:hypothetical protein